MTTKEDLCKEHAHWINVYMDANNRISELFNSPINFTVDKFITLLPKIEKEEKIMAQAMTMMRGIQEKLANIGT